MPHTRSMDADEVKEEPSEFNDDDYEYRSIIQLFWKSTDVERIQLQDKMEKVPCARFVVCRRRDLSPRPFDYESNALTKLSYPGALSSFRNVISERIIYSIQGRRLPNLNRHRWYQHGSNYRFWIDRSAHDANSVLKSCTKSISHKWNNFYAVFL
jgi:hypothetical protein